MNDGVNEDLVLTRTQNSRSLETSTYLVALMLARMLDFMERQHKEKQHEAAV